MTLSHRVQEPTGAMTLPWAVVRADNHRLIPAYGRKGLIAAPKYREGKAAQRLLLAAQWRSKPLSGAVEVVGRVWMPDRRKRDAGNYRKCITDAMSGICYDDDAQVWREVWERAGVSRDNPRIEIEVRLLSEAA